MKKYNVLAQDANYNVIQIFVGCDEVQLNEFLTNYCYMDEKDVDPRDKNCRWLKAHHLPEFDIPYRAQGWIVRFCEAKDNSMERNFLNKKIHILTENADGNLYMLEANDYNELVNDWSGDRNYVPAHDAKVYFASYNGKPINPYAYTDFESLVRHMRAELV